MYIDKYDTALLSPNNKRINFLIQMSWIWYSISLVIIPISFSNTILYRYTQEPDSVKGSNDGFFDDNYIL